jgi:hypothetical protein
MLGQYGKSEMNDADRKLIAKNAIEIKNSLDMSMKLAGGSIIPASELDNMTALDLLALLCTNDIRFTYYAKEEMK